MCVGLYEDICGTTSQDSPPVVEPQIFVEPHTRVPQMKGLKIDQNQGRRAFWTSRKKKEKIDAEFQKYSCKIAASVCKIGVHIVEPGCALLSVPWRRSRNWQAALPLTRRDKCEPGQVEALRRLPARFRDSFALSFVNLGAGGFIAFFRSRNFQNTNTCSSMCRCLAPAPVRVQMLLCQVTEMCGTVPFGCLLV